MFGGYCSDCNGGCLNMNSCLKFNSSNSSWKKFRVMNKACVACVVFQVSTVASGGINNGGILNSVESFDFFADNWTPMPKLLNTKSNHNLVVVKN